MINAIEMTRWLTPLRSKKFGDMFAPTDMEYQYRKGGCRAWLDRAIIDDELKQVVIGIARVDAPANGTPIDAPNDALDRSLFDAGPCNIKLVPELIDGA